MFQLALIAARNLLRHRRRTLLLGSAIAVVTALLVVLQSLSAGAQEMMFRSATVLHTGHVNVGGFYKVTAGQSSALVTEFASLEEVVKQQVPELDYLASRGRGWGLVISNSRSLKLDISGIDPKELPELQRHLNVVKGDAAELAEPGTILIFERHASQLGLDVGDIVTISATTFRGVANTVDVRVAAIARDMGLISKFTILMPNPTVRELLQVRSDATGALHLYLKDVADVPAVQERLRVAFAEAGYRVMEPDPRIHWMKFDTINQEAWTGQKLDISSWEDETSLLKFTLGALRGISAVLIGILLLVIATGTINTLWISIRERTREIGTLRAIGMGRGRVVALFLWEALLLGLFATLSGGLLGALACAGLNAAGLSGPEGAEVVLMTERLHFAVSPATVLGSAAFITLAVALVSTLPAFAAARLRPVTAMAHVD